MTNSNLNQSSFIINSSNFVQQQQATYAQPIVLNYGNVINSSKILTQPILNQQQITTQSNLAGLTNGVSSAVKTLVADNPNSNQAKNNLAPSWRNIFSILNFN